MDASPTPTGPKGFPVAFVRTREIFSGHTLQEFFAVISLFALVYVIQLIWNIFLGDQLSWFLTIFPFALLVWIYNEIAQAKGKNIKYALFLDWLELPVKTHLYIIMACSALTIFIKWFFPANPSKGIIEWKSGPKTPANSPIAYE